MRSTEGSDGSPLRRALARTLQEAAAGRGRAVESAVEQARRAGAEDMRTAWLRWQFRILPPQLGAADTAFIAGRLAAVPRTDWDVARLRRHGQSVWSLRDAASRTSLHEEVEARLDRVAVMICDLTDEEFDTGLGQARDEYLYHPDRVVRAAYLAGGSEGLAEIMRTISEVRARARRDADARAAMIALARQRNAALRALRELDRSVEGRDAHAAWEAEARQIGGP